MSEKNGVPVWFWIVSGLGLVWNLIGGAMFASYMSMNEKDFSELPTGDQTYYSALPAWYDAIFGVAVLAGILGCVGLLMRKAWAFPALLVSLLAVILQNGVGYGMFNATELLGTSAYGMTATIVGIGLILVWFAHFSKGKGFLG